jgi:hypothetical protein
MRDLCNLAVLVGVGFEDGRAVGPAILDNGPQNLGITSAPTRMSAAFYLMPLHEKEKLSLN